MSKVYGLVQPFGYGLAYPDWLDVTTPAAGANASVVVGGENSIRVVAARATLVTDANVASRVLTLDYLDGRGNTRCRNGAGVTVTASDTGETYEWNNSRGSAEWNTGTPVFAPLAPLLIPPGCTIRFTVTNIQAGDQLSALSLWVERFPTGDNGYPLGAGVNIAAE
jgi:hypothetical protein